MFYAFMENCFNTLAPAAKQNKNKAKPYLDFKMTVTFISNLHFVGAHSQVFSNIGNCVFPPDGVVNGSPAPRKFMEGLCDCRVEEPHRQH